MSMIRTLGSQTVTTAGKRVPAYSVSPTACTSFVIKNKLATIVVANTLNAGDQVILYGFTTATYFNGIVLQVNAANATSFSFPFNHADVNSTSDAGLFALPPVERYRYVRIECDSTLSTHNLYVGDLNVSSSRYTANLSLAGQIAWDQNGEAIDVSRIMVDSDFSGAVFQTSVIQ